MRQLPDNSSTADPVPTFVLKQIIDLIVPFVTELFRRSLATGRFLSRFKDASITPTVKKVGLDPSDASSYRPISNLAAFDTVDHEILIQRLQSTYNIHSSVLQWFRSYLLGRTQHVRRGSARSSAVHLAL